MTYEHLLSPLTIRGKTFKNRMVAAPTGYGHFLLNSHMDYMHMIEERAAGGFAEVCVGECSINDTDAKRAGESIDMSGPDSPHFGLIQNTANVIHKYGAIAMMELFHPGPSGDPNEIVPRPWGPVAFTRDDGVEVIAYDAQMMAKTADDFANCAVFLKQAGFDGIVIHGGHGWLFTSFLSPRENTRTDEYGGEKLENRARFPLMILRRIREKVGEDFLIELRLSGSERYEGGSTADQMAEFSTMLSGLVDILHVSSGHYYKSYRTKEFSSLYDPHGVNLDSAAIIRKKCPKDVVLGVIGGLNSPEQCEEVIADDIVDLVIFGRQAFADPNFANKVAAGHPEDINRCLRCMRCYAGSHEHPMELAYNARHHFTKEELLALHRKRAERIGPYNAFCSVNPTSWGMGMSQLPEYPAPLASRKVLVIGGGVGGMTAAITAADRGHQVTLVEASDKLGGILWFVDAEPEKIDLKNFRELLIRRVQERNINVLLNTRADADFVANFGADAVIIAVGAHPLRLNLPGIDDAIPALDLFHGDLSAVGENVVVIGGGLVGCDTAILLGNAGRKVTIVELQERLAMEVKNMAFTMIADKLDEFGCKYMLETTCLAIQPNGVQVRHADGTEEFVAADSVVFALGMQSNKDTVAELTSKLPEGTFVRNVGDSKAVARIGDAGLYGYIAAAEIR